MCVDESLVLARDQLFLLQAPSLDLPVHFARCGYTMFATGSRRRVYRPRGTRLAHQCHMVEKGQCGNDMNKEEHT